MNIKCESCPLKNKSEDCISQHMYGAYCKYVGENHIGYIRLVMSSGIIPEKRKVPEYPPITEQIKTFTQAMIDRVKDRFKDVPPEVSEHRLSICAGSGDIPKCEFFNLDGTRRCHKCACPMDWKVTFISAECPIQKWGKYTG